MRRAKSKPHVMSNLLSMHLIAKKVMGENVVISDGTLFGRSLPQTLRIIHMGPKIPWSCHNRVSDVAVKFHWYVGVVFVF